jgi:hypothetical protein
MVLSLKLGLGFLSFFNESLLPNFEKIVEGEFLIIGLSNSKTSSASHVLIGELAFKCCVW